MMPPGGRGRRTTASDETRTRILDAARDLAVDEGFSGSTVEKVAEHAGVSRMTVYYQFGAKADLGRPGKPRIVAVRTIPTAALPQTGRWPSARATGVDRPRPRGGEETAPSEPALSAETIVSFDVPGPELSVELERAQSGTLVLMRSGETRRATVRSTGNSAELRVVPGGIMILNASEDAGSLALDLPPQVERVRLRVGDAEARVISLEPDVRRLEIRLGGDAEVEAARS
jgi:hypothetical protein